MAPKVAVLYQAIEAPLINGVRKPMKPGGYRDSSADVAYVLRHQTNTTVITPMPHPNPSSDGDWCFPDNESGILSAIHAGATHLWANTILFASHPLQTSADLDQFAPELRVVGQAPCLVESYDDKDVVNSLLREDGRFLLPKCQIVSSPSEHLKIPFPLIAKPIRGRGSHGVKLCRNQSELTAHLDSLLAESSPAMLEQYLSGAEGTVTVMPPSESDPKYRSLPIVLRFNHADGIAPYSGVVAVTANSRVPSETELASNHAYAQIMSDCEAVAEILKVTAPIRIDVRQPSEDPVSRFAIFDVNMKPNMTGPGRPGRENQASLTAMAAERVGWDYPRLLQEILSTARSLHDLRKMDVETKK